MVDITTRCTVAGECVAAVIPKPGEPAGGICKLDDNPCGSFIEIKDGIAQPAYHVD
jgi:hypothetical protein